MNKTKVIATIGPASQSEDVLEKLIKSGIDVARINMSHCSHENCEKIINIINGLNNKLGTNISIMLDVSGPNLRTHRFENGRAYLRKGDKIKIYMTEVLGDNTKFSVNYSRLIEDVSYGSIIKLNGGLIELEVLDKGNNFILCEVLDDGFIEDNKSISVPNVNLKLPFLNSKDKDDILFAVEHHVDFLALSFVESSENILEINDLLISLNDDHMSIIAKVENNKAVEDIDNIIRVSDGIMIARGDLGTEIPLERVPSIQKMIIKKCHMEGKISIVATDLLATMENLQLPTRAEVSDIANAVLDGTDAVLLSEETTIGKYPVETVSTMEKILKNAELDIDHLELTNSALRTEKTDTTGVIAYNVTETANRLKCKAIITPTISGYTAKKISRFRPSCPVIAISPDIETVKSLNLHFGITPVLVDDISSFDEMISLSKDIATKLLDIEEKDKVVITGGYPFKSVKHTNFMKIEEL